MSLNSWQKLAIPYGRTHRGFSSGRIVLFLGVIISNMLGPGQDVATATTTWDWPLHPAQLTRTFNPPAKPWLPGHRGVDLRGHKGQAVFSAGTGWVSFADNLAGKPVVVVSHRIRIGSTDRIMRTTFEPVRATVSVGDYVQTGDLIGHLATGDSHCAANNRVSCLHWGLREGFGYHNPLLLVGRVRLLPMPG